MVQRSVLNIHIHTKKPNTGSEAKLWSQQETDSLNIVSSSRGNHILKVLRVLKMQNLASPKSLQWADSHTANDPCGLRATNKISAVARNVGNAPYTDQGCFPLATSNKSREDSQWKKAQKLHCCPMESNCPTVSATAGLQLPPMGAIPQTWVVPFHTSKVIGPLIACIFSSVECTFVH